MAIVRCSEHPPTDRMHRFVTAVEPIGYPETALLCGHSAHGEAVPGLVLLTEAEYARYERGQRSFGLTGTATRVEVSDTVRDLPGLALSRPPEPSVEALECEGTDSVEQAFEDDPDALAEAVRSYLWDEHWEDSLTARGLTRQEFTDETATTRPTLEDWTTGSVDWDVVLDRYAEALAVALRPTESTSPP